MIYFQNVGFISFVVLLSKACLANVRAGETLTVPGLIPGKGSGPRFTPAPGQCPPPPPPAIVPGLGAKASGPRPPSWPPGMHSPPGMPPMPSVEPKGISGPRQPAGPPPGLQIPPGMPPIPPVDAWDSGTCIKPCDYVSFQYFSLKLCIQDHELIV